MNAECGFYKYCYARDCEECKKSMERISSIAERKRLKVEQLAKRAAAREARRIETQPKREQAVERKRLKVEREELAKESKSRCIKCNEIRDIDCFRIAPSTNYPDRRAFQCTECEKKYYLESRGDIVLHADKKAEVSATLATGIQKCNKCSIDKSLNSFDKCPINKGVATELSTGYVKVCKDCHREREQKNRESLVTPEQLLAREQRAARSIEVAKEKEEQRLRVEQRDAERAHPDYKAGQRKKVMEKRKSRMNTDPAYRIKITLRSRIRKLIKGKKKIGSHIRDLGCSVAELKIYLESKFKRGMTWENHGKIWHIDHIIALSTFDLTIRAEYLKAVHYTNLQPLTIKANLEKGNGHIDGQQFCLI